MLILMWAKSLNAPRLGVAPRSLENVWGWQFPHSKPTFLSNCVSSPSKAEIRWKTRPRQNTWIRHLFWQCAFYFYFFFVPTMSICNTDQRQYRDSQIYHLSLKKTFLNRKFSLIWHVNDNVLNSSGTLVFTDLDQVWKRCLTNRISFN